MNLSKSRYVVVKGKTISNLTKKQTNILQLS